MITVRSWISPMFGQCSCTLVMATMASFTCPFSDNKQSQNGLMKKASVLFKHRDWVDLSLHHFNHIFYFLKCFLSCKKLTQHDSYEYVPIDDIRIKRWFTYQGKFLRVRPMATITCYGGWMWFIYIYQDKICACNSSMDTQ